MLGSPILYLKGRRRMMFQLSGFYFTGPNDSGLGLGLYSDCVGVSLRFVVVHGFHSVVQGHIGFDIGIHRDLEISRC